MKKSILAALVLLLALAAGSFMMPAATLVKASDHDDGETDVKSRNASITDMYVFKEENQATVTETGAPVVAGQNLIVIMNTNPRSLPRQQYFFSTTYKYEFHFGRVPNSATPPGAVGGTGGQMNDILRFTFGAPNASNQQSITCTRVAVNSGVETVGNSVLVGSTTPARPGLGTTAVPTPTPVINSFALDGFAFTCFAGLREDPFFFDVTQFFKVRAFIRGEGPAADVFTVPGFDFAKNYNVNAIVLRVPLTFLRGATAVNAFDVFGRMTLVQ